MVEESPIPAPIPNPRGHRRGAAWGARLVVVLVVAMVAAGAYLVTSDPTLYQAGSLTSAGVGGSSMLEKNEEVVSIKADAGSDGEEGTGVRGGEGGKQIVPAEEEKGEKGIEEEKGEKSIEEEKGERIIETEKVEKDAEEGSSKEESGPAPASGEETNVPSESEKQEKEPRDSQDLTASQVFSRLGGSTIQKNRDLLTLPNWGPIPDNCIADLVARADESYARNLQRRGREVPAVKEIAGVVNKLLVPTYPCFLEQRLGKGGEGGKWACRGYVGVDSVEKAVPTVVSIGCHGETTFEEDINKVFGSVTDTFDPYLSGILTKKVSNMTWCMRFHKNGIMGKAALAKWMEKTKRQYPELMMDLPGFISFIRREQGKGEWKGEGKAADIFKIDCDGCEIDFIPDLEVVGKDKQPFGQVLIEVHTMEEPKGLTLLMSQLESAGYRLFHAEANAYCYRRCYELAYIHSSLVTPPSTPRLSKEEDVECLDALTTRADIIFEANWRRKTWPLSTDSIPEHQKWQNVFTLMLVADYPCAQQERFGVWDKGGVWACLRHRSECPTIKKGTPRGREGGGDTVIVTLGGRGSLAGSQDAKFEEELAGLLGIKAHVLNPSLANALQPRGSSVTWHNAEVVSSSTKGQPQGDARQLGLGELLGYLRADKVYLLRVDCNGCEISLVADMRDMFTRETVPFGQIAMVVRKHRETQEMLMVLNALGYRQFHAEEVGYDEVSFELAFIHETCV